MKSVGVRSEGWGLDELYMMMNFTDYVYLESISFDTIGFEVVVVGIERCEFGWKHGKFDQSVLSQRQFLQEN